MVGVVYPYSIISFTFEGAGTHGCVTPRSWLTSGTLRWSWDPRPPSPQVMELSAVKRGDENYFFTTEILSVEENISIQSVIRPLVAAPDALDMLGGCAAAPTR